MPIYAQPTTHSIIAESSKAIKIRSDRQPQIALPTSPSRRGNAFELLILSYYNSVRGLIIEEWSSCLYGDSGKLYQCDGVITDGSRRFLLESKFFAKRPVNLRDLKIDRREQAARDLNCVGIACVSLNGFDDSVREWQNRSDLEILLVEWKDLRTHILSRISGIATVLIDEFEISGDLITARNGSQLRTDPEPIGKPMDNFPEFICFPDALEKWLRRLPKLGIAQHELTAGHFLWRETEDRLRLIADRKSDLSLLEAWEIEDAFYGYAARVYDALKATAIAVSNCPDQPLSDLQKWLHANGWKTGEKGVRKALDGLILLGFLRKRSVGRRVHYDLTPIGNAYVNAGERSEIIFKGQLENWSPYKFMLNAIENGKVTPDRRLVIEYFNSQYKPYEPYARSLFNDNSADGLLSLYRRFNRSE